MFVYKLETPWPTLEVPNRLAPLTLGTAVILNGLSFEGSCPTVALRRGFSNRAQQDLQSVHPRFVPCSGLRALYTGLTCLLHNEKVHDPYELLSRFVGGPETCPDTMDPVEFRGLRTLLSRRVSWNL
ncbi:hypothetical protein TKK_0015316 [Trichogramma kaykai]